MDVLIVRLRSSGFGCYLFGVYFSCLMFADAILLLAHTVSAMRDMLKICDLFICPYAVNYDKCKKNCSLSTTYNGEMTHRKQQK